MADVLPKTFSYFPGCSLATSAKENNQSLIQSCRRLGIELVELTDWNCCGSSSAHSVNSTLAARLATRNLALAPKGRPLLVACPSCMLRLTEAQLHLQKDAAARRQYEEDWGREVDDDLEIIHFFELLDRLAASHLMPDTIRRLAGLKCVPYYGCMLARPPHMRHLPDHFGLMERVLTQLGAEPLSWSFASRCCGTFLSVARPDVVSPLVDQIVQGASAVGADCIVTACAMCHLNLEVRCTLKQPLPTFHFSEILALALGITSNNGWFARHLVDPRPLLQKKGLLP
jgi:heterodisulfide reductase subunit B